MHRSLAPSIVFFFLIAALSPTNTSAATSINRRDGFLQIWNSTGRPAQITNEKPFIDVLKGDLGFLAITYAKARGILDDTDTRFYPDKPLSATDALLLLFRTRSIERLKKDGTNDFMKLPEREDVPVLAEKYKLSYDVESTSLTAEQLLAMMQNVDKVLASEVHEVSLYSEKFHGKGTAFGETFDMYAMTAAHRSFPHNTLVRVTNIANNKSVDVRINDRGPFVNGRDLDLSLGSFTQIADRSSGKINATFQRLGDADVVRRCDDNRRQIRITKDVRLNPGIPHSYALGKTLRLRSSEPFVVRNVIYPDGISTGIQTWITKDETYEFTPSVVGMYQFLMGTKTGRMSIMQMNVVECGTTN